MSNEKNEIAELRKTCAAIECKIDNLERMVQSLHTLLLAQAQAKAPPKTTTATNVVAAWPRPDYTWREWWSPVISTTDYEMLDYLPYHECLKQTLLKLTFSKETSKAPLASLYRGETYSLYIYNDTDNQAPPEWKLADNQDVLEMLDLLNLAFHRYYFDYVETKMAKERAKERDKERANERAKERDNIEKHMINLCKINENKYRDELRLRDVRKSLAKRIGTK